MASIYNRDEGETNVITCTDFNSAYCNLTTDDDVENKGHKYNVQLKGIDKVFSVWKENKALRSRFNGNFFDLIDGNSTELLVKLKSSPSFIRYECTDSLNALVLHLVCYHGLSEFVRDFISSENRRRPGNFLYTPLHYACLNPLKNGDELKTVQEIIKVAGSQVCKDNSLHGYLPTDYTNNPELIQYLTTLEEET